VEPIPSQESGFDTIVVSSSQTTVKPGDEVQFTAKGLGKQGQEIKIDNLSWSATGGTINAAGVYEAGLNEGVFVVTANAGEVQGSGSISIVREGGRPPKRIVISPQDANIGRNEIQTFAAKGFDEDGHEVPLIDIRWSAIGGTVDDNGVFLSGQEEGIFKVIATVGDANGLATIKVMKRNSHWEGEIPHQKWTQFYNRILSKFAVRKGLKLAVAVDISDATKEEVEEMRTALRELGLGDNVE